MTLPRPSAALPGLLALAVGLGGCGSSEDEKKPEEGGPSAAATTETSTQPPRPERSADGCAPAELGEEAARDVGSGRTVKRRAEGAAELAGARVKVKVLQATSHSSLLIRFGRRKAFTPPRRHVLFGVTYRLRNAGSEPIKPAVVVNRQAVVETEDGKLYRSAEGAGCDRPLSASWAVGEKDASAQAPVAPRKARTTAVVFVVPRGEEAVELHVPGLAFALPRAAS